MNECEEYKFLYNICSQLIKVQDNKEIFNTIIHDLCTSFGAIASSLWIVNTLDDVGFNRIAYYQSSQNVHSFLPTLDFKLTHFTAKNKLNLICYNLKGDCNFKEVTDDIHITSSPLVVKNELIGILNIWCNSEDPNRCHHIDLLPKIIGEIGHGLYNYKYYSNDQSKRIKKELEFAGKVQHNLLPKNLPEIKGLSIAIRSRMAREVGGDYVDVFKTERNNLGIAIGDVMGKGIPAALWTTVARAILRVTAKADSLPHLVLNEVNLQLFEDMAKQEMFLTLLYGWYEPFSHTFIFSSAGHHNPIIIHSQSGEYEKFNLKGLFIGGRPDTKYKSKGIRLNKDDILIIYSDGLIEAVNDQDQQFGLNNLIEVVIRNSFYKATEIMDSLWLHLGQHIGDHVQLDDISCIILKVGE